MKRFQVEFDFADTMWGRRAMQMKGFDTRVEAEAFAKTKEDANVFEFESAWTWDEQGNEVKLW